MTPDVTHIGHAGFIVNYGHVQVVMDPWFSSACLGSWFPSADNRHYMSSVMNPDFVYISHHHEDHFDREFLKTLHEGTEFIVPNFRSHYLELELRKLGFYNLTVLDHGHSYNLAPGFVVTMLIDSSHKEDSALLLDMGGVRFLNSNDCELPRSAWPNMVDVLACQFSGAFWYPQCYDYEPDVMTRKAAQVRELNLERMVGRVHVTGARNYLPSAGPPVFLDPELERFNDRSGIFPWWEDVAGQFAKECPDVGVLPYLKESNTDFDSYQRERFEDWYEYYTMDDSIVTTDELDAYFNKLQRLNSRFLGEYRNDICLGTDEQGPWNIRLGRLASQLEEAPDPKYWIKAPARVLRAVLDGRASWDEALTSMRCSLSRSPDEYDSTLMTLLQYGARPAQTMAIVRRRDGSEMLERDGLVMPRWCPHAGEDMKFASICDGIIECPRHHWKWDAATGKCVSGGDVSLTVRPA